MIVADNLDGFGALLEAARRQEEPQRLLFVFARREPDHGAVSAQRTRREGDKGGYLQPCLCVDKTPPEIADFAALVAESDQTGQHWDIVFVGGLAGRGGIPPNSDEAAQPLRFMVNAINDGRVAQFAAFDREGNVLRFR
ncbi:MAG: ribonucleotide reductase subunit alpha [Proteobacteria bacterium]|nr:ribonucleotide reductase subunit alpha [Pseudomonadota bacterium]